MKNIFTILLLTLLVSCSSVPPTKKPPNTGDNSKVSKFEKQLFCGTSKRYATIMGKVGSELKRAWKKSEGKLSADKCTVRIKTDRLGNIVNHEIFECDKPEVVSKILEIASPINLPKDQCLSKKVNEIKFVINNGI